MIKSSEDIFVITEEFTKYSQAVLCKDQTARTVARVLRDIWIVHYGIPCRTYSGQERNFEGLIMAEICKFYNVTKTRATPYHTQGNGQTERMNQTLCALIRLVQSDRRRQ